MLPSGYKSGGGREALWPSGQCAAVGGELGEGSQTARVLIPVVGDAPEILDSSFSVAFITLAASAESLPLLLGVIQVGTSYSFLALS